MPFRIRQASESSSDQGDYSNLEHHTSLPEPANEVGGGARGKDPAGKTLEVKDLEGKGLGLAVHLAASPGLPT